MSITRPESPPKILENSIIDVSSEDVYSGKPLDTAYVGNKLPAA
ncbi:hypothetical protein [Vulcanisaeta sp. JCM 14467]|nr:hypothetical protein [Vulcanisaeta sp. JCM 14467]